MFHLITATDQPPPTGGFFYFLPALPGGGAGLAGGAAVTGLATGACFGRRLICLGLSGVGKLLIARLLDFVVALVKLPVFRYVWPLR